MDEELRQMISLSRRVGLLEGVLEGLLASLRPPRVDSEWLSSAMEAAERILAEKEML